MNDDQQEVVIPCRGLVVFRLVCALVHNAQ